MAVGGKKKKIWVVLALLAVAGAAAAVMVVDPFGSGGSSAAPATASAVLRDFSSSIMATGAVKPEVGAEVNVGARVSGKVLQLNVDIGDSVRKGDVLAVLEHDDLDAQVRKMEAELTSARTQLEAEKSRAFVDAQRARAVVEQRKADVATEQERLVVLGTQRQADLDLQTTKLASLRRQLSQEAKTAKTRIHEAAAQHTLTQTTQKRMEVLFDRGMLAEQSLDTAKAEREGASSRLTTARATHTMASIRRDEEVATQESAVAVAQARLTTDVRLQEQILVQAERALDLARADLAAVEAKSAANISVLTAVIPQVEATLAEARVRLSYATITAPIGGVVGTVTTQVGETVAAGFNAPIFVTLIDLDRLQVDAFVDEVDIGKVRTGQKAIFTVDSYPSEEFTGTVTAIYPRAVIQDNVVYYDVVISLDEPHGDRLRPEMTTSVTILLDERKDVLAIPTAAVRRESGKNFVRVPDEARPDAPPQTREVKLGWRDGGWVEVTNGLQEGEIVLLPEGTVQGNGR